MKTWPKKKSWSISIIISFSFVFLHLVLSVSRIFLMFRVTGIMF